MNAGGAGAASFAAADFVFILANDSRSTKRAESVVLARLGALGWDEPSVFAVKLALEEAVSNAVRHGNCDDPVRFVRVEFSADAENAEIAVIDEGCGFDPAAVPDPTVPENLELPSGRGIMLMRAFMNEISFNRSGNRVTMVKRKGHCPPCGA